MKCWMCRLPQNSKRRGWYQMVLIYKGLASNHRNTKVYTVVYHIATCITEITNYIKHFKSKKCILLITHQSRMLNFLLLLLLTVITLRSQFRNALTCTVIHRHTHGTFISEITATKQYRKTPILPYFLSFFSPFLMPS